MGKKKKAKGTVSAAAEAVQKEAMLGQIKEAAAKGQKSNALKKFHQYCEQDPPGASQACQAVLDGAKAFLKKKVLILKRKRNSQDG